MKKIFRNKIFMAAAILVIVFVAVTVLFAVFGKEGSTVQRAAETVVSPFQKVFTAGWSRLSHFSKAMTKYDELEAENEELKARIREMEALIRDAESYREENQQLRALLGMEEKNPDTELVSALVIAWNDASWSSVFTINKGSSDGIEVGDAVIVDAGLVGIVTAVSRRNAEVSTVLDTSVKIVMNIFQSDLEVVGGGEFSLMKEGMLRVSDIPLGSNVKLGDTIMTEENGGVPGGILVGTISGIKTEAHGMSDYAVVTPSADIEKLSQVFVVTDYVSAAETGD